MVKKDDFGNESDDVWAFPGNDEDEASPQNGAVIREYHFESSEWMLLDYQIANQALPNFEDEKEQSDKDSCETEEVII